MCKEKDCKIRPNYNKEGETKALYCLKHKLNGMVDIKNKTCIYPNCTIRPVFNIEGDTKALYCSAHKTDGMVNVISKICIHPDCKIRPNYNKPGESTALYCSVHKTDEMVNVISKICVYPDCKKQPVFNKEGESTALYCSAHKLDGMMNIKNKTCIHPNCKIRPVFNKEGESTGLYCSAHKLDRMVNVKDKTCKSEWCLTQVKKEKYDGYCLFCYMNIYPDKPVSRNYKTKEYSVVENIKTKFPNLSWIADKIINGGCSKRRPDLLLDLGYQIIIVEVDENQHGDYDCSCENKRIMELSRDLGHRPIVFIRFNPDDYTKNATNITSCWGQDKNGICVVKKSKKNEWNERLHTLEEHINYWVNPANITNKTIETIQLFYDV
jgi:hypothetical protein